ncbi:hypothetical protein [Nostoc sp.]|uniref:hypothetical protein n=1 Tax=Nostoc sp. TaxID=1180 RepID=UPI002FF94E2D
MRARYLESLIGLSFVGFSTSTAIDWAIALKRKLSGCASTDNQSHLTAKRSSGRHP